MYSLINELKEAFTIKEAWEKLYAIYGDRFLKALEAVDLGHVKKYLLTPSGRFFWVVVGKERDYWVLPGFFCTCDDFYVNVVTRARSKYCYHLLAQALAEALLKYEVFNVSDEEGEALIAEWRTMVKNHKIHSKKVKRNY
ncbi:MAG: hypothetical protein QXK12_02555 [Candidatus Nezhaarchaeales archaeon]